MRQFVVVAHEAPLDADFSLDDLAGGAGRLDVLCRCTTAALLVSHGVRDDARIHLVVQDELTITVDGATVRRLNPDERSTAARLRDALQQRDEAIGHRPVEVSSGVTLRRRGLAPTLDACAEDGPLVALHEDGDPATAVAPPTDPIFVLSDHRDFTDDERDLLEDRADRRLRLGPEPLHADQAITVAHNWLDTDGWTAP